MEISTTRRPRRPWRLLATAISGVLTLLALAFLVPTAMGLQRYVITGSSMTGTIDLGSVVYEEVVPVSDLRVGDVITYLPPPDSGIDHLVTHRIIAIHGKTFRTKGDAVEQPDPWKFKLNAADQARVKFSVPHVGWVFIALADRTTRMAVIGVPATLIALLSLVQLVTAIVRRPKGLPAAEPAAASLQSSSPPTSIPVG